MGIAVDPNFQPTPNLRNTSMLTEAEMFSNHLKRVEKEIRTVKTATEGMLRRPFYLCLEARLTLYAHNKTW